MTKTKKFSGWEMAEKGWWTRPGVGGVVREHSGLWGCYPLELNDNSPAHVATTLSSAIQWIEKRYAEKALR